MFDLVNGLLGFVSDLFQTHPNQDSTGDVVADNSGFATLTSLQASKLLGFAMKLLDLPTYATRILCGLRVILSQVVRDDIVRALCRQHHPEQFPLVVLGKALDLDHFAVLALFFSPIQRVYPAIGRSTT